MFGGVAVQDCYDITEGRWIKERTRTREGRPEMYFFLSDPERVLPVYLDGRTRVIQWGVRRGQDHRLPQTPWVVLADLESGHLASLEPEAVVIRATRAIDNGIWYEVVSGVRGVLVHHAQGMTVVYPLLEPASHYYRAMTGSESMPSLVRQRI
jgi:hypothetical protein